MPTVGAPVAVVAREPIVAFSTSLTDLTMIHVQRSTAPRYLAVTESDRARGLLLINDGAYVANNSQGLVGYDVGLPPGPGSPARR